MAIQMNTITVNQKVGHWRVLVVDRHRVTCICRCGTVRILNAEELSTGTVTSSCGCAPTNDTENKLKRQSKDFERWRREQRSWKPNR
jgi:hypothetical protein